jgi:hypothetical protein
MGTKTRKLIAAGLGVIATAVPLAACGGGPSGTAAPAGSAFPQGSEPVKLDPADFTTKIDNPYWPMRPGSRWVYRETDQEGARKRVVVTVTRKTKRIANGIEAAVVHDVVTEGGQPIEITDDWYAQDRAGNVWYLGEDTAEYENGKVTTRKGSFEAGVDGAQPGIIMPANPRPGMTYRQEYYKGQAEDKAGILSLNQQAEVPSGHFTDVVMTNDTVPIEPKINQFKFFARGVGPVLSTTVSAGSDREELVSYTEGR